ncbi:MAG: hypothetical protein H6734_17600 [Alphaproteobacteria bacterium]|nr:hypothetical protein [Alphaproteobacteria bacterium]
MRLVLLGLLACNPCPEGPLDATFEVSEQDVQDLLALEGREERGDIPCAAACTRFVEVIERSGTILTLDGCTLDVGDPAPQPIDVVGELTCTGTWQPICG